MNVVFKTLSMLWQTISKTSISTIILIACQSQMNSQIKAQVWQMKILVAQVNTNQFSLNKISSFQHHKPLSLFHPQWAKQQLMLQHSSQQILNLSIKSKFLFQQSLYRILLRRKKLMNKLRKILVQRRPKQFLLFQMVVGNALNAKITTLKAEIIATGAKKKKMMMILSENQNICHKQN